MQERDKIIEEIARSGLLKSIFSNMSIKDNDKDDLEQEIYLILLDYDEEKIIEMYKNKQLKWFIIKIIQNQYYSKNSPFYTKYKKYYQFIDGEEIKNKDEIDE